MCWGYIGGLADNKVMDLHPAMRRPTMPATMLLTLIGAVLLDVVVVAVVVAVVVVVVVVVVDAVADVAAIHYQCGVDGVHIHHNISDHRTRSVTTVTTLPGAADLR